MKKMQLKNKNVSSCKIYKSNHVVDKVNPLEIKIIPTKNE